MWSRTFGPSGDGTTTPFGLNQERSSDTAVLYTKAMVHAPYEWGIDLVLERTTNSAWLPCASAGYMRREFRKFSITATLLSIPIMVLSIGPSWFPYVLHSTGAMVQIATGTTPT